MTILVNTELFTIESDLDDDVAKKVAEAVAKVFSQHRLEGNETNGPIRINADDMIFTLRYKNLS